MKPYGHQGMGGWHGHRGHFGWGHRRGGFPFLPFLPIFIIFAVIFVFKTGLWLPILLAGGGIWLYANSTRNGGVDMDAMRDKAKRGLDSMHQQFQDWDARAGSGSDDLLHPDKPKRREDDSEYV